MTNYPAAAASGGPEDDGGASSRAAGPLPLPGRRRPNPCTYWVVEGRLLAGEYPTGSSWDASQSRRRLRDYLDAGIAHFVDLTEPDEKIPYEALLREVASEAGIDGVTYRRVPVEDFGVPSRDTMKRILDAIDESLLAGDDGGGGGGVYVHCRGGIGRTGTAVGCYLVRHLRCTGDQALREVNRLFQASDRRYGSPHSPETAEQVRFIREWTEPSSPAV